MIHSSASKKVPDALELREELLQFLYLPEILTLTMNNVSFAKTNLNK